MAGTINVLISAPARPEAYDLIFLLGRGDVFGERQPVSIILYGTPAQEIELKLLAGEVYDSALEALQDIVIITNLEAAFQNVDVAIMLDTVESNHFTYNDENLKQCKRIYAKYGEHLDKYGKQTVRVIVAGDPVNTNTYIMCKYAPSLSQSCFSGLLRMDQNRATCQIARKLYIPVESVRNVIVWGNSGRNAFVDIAHAEIQSETGLYVPAVKKINDVHWVKHILQPYIQDKCSEKSSDSAMAIQKAKAIVDHIKDLWFGTSENWTSMIVNSNGEYGTPKNCFFGFPVTVADPNKKPEIVANLNLDSWGEIQFERTVHEIEDFKKRILQIDNCEEHNKTRP
ncbi:hypothetical protein Aperf_G00000054051 [Anoplocephala perfoliata]